MRAGRTSYGELPPIGVWTGGGGELRQADSEMGREGYIWTEGRRVCPDRIDRKPTQMSAPNEDPGTSTPAPATPSAGMLQFKQHHPPGQQQQDGEEQATVDTTRKGQYGGHRFGRGRLCRCRSVSSSNEELT
jgi:hypothetical protein